MRRAVRRPCHVRIFRVTAIRWVPGRCVARLRPVTRRSVRSDALCRWRHCDQPLKASLGVGRLEILARSPQNRRCEFCSDLLMTRKCNHPSACYLKHGNMEFITYGNPHVLWERPPIARIPAMSLLGNVGLEPHTAVCLRPSFV
ncbi:hypothetical protein J2W42_004915 [Rhizobium tibeticum]|nr:hypothetical protein [Rhizobium tibeticum]